MATTNFSDISPELLSSLWKCFESVPNSASIKKVFEQASKLVPKLPEYARCLGKAVKHLLSLDCDASSAEEIRQYISALIEEYDIKKIYEYINGKGTWDSSCLNDKLSTAATHGADKCEALKLVKDVTSELGDLANNVLRKNLVCDAVQCLAMFATVAAASNSLNIKKERIVSINKRLINIQRQWIEPALNIINNNKINEYNVAKRSLTYAKDELVDLRKECQLLQSEVKWDGVGILGTAIMAGTTAFSSLSSVYHLATVASTSLLAARGVVGAASAGVSAWGMYVSFKHLKTYQELTQIVAKIDIVINDIDREVKKIKDVVLPELKEYEKQIVETIKIENDLKEYEKQIKIENDLKKQTSLKLNADNFKIIVCLCIVAILFSILSNMSD